MAKGVRYSLAELDIMLSTYKRLVHTTPRMEIYEELSKVFEGKYPAASIGNAIQRYQPTTNIAEVILKRGAARLASRIVRRANVTEAVDILSRPNIGVLDPIKKSEGGGGFIISMQADSCGAVKVGVAFGQQPEHPQLSSGDSHEGVIITSHRVEEDTNGRNQETINAATLEGTLVRQESGHSGADGVYAKALARSRARLEAAKGAGQRPGWERKRRSRSQPGGPEEESSVQGADEQSEA